MSTNFEQQFYAEVKDKKRSVFSARHKKNGSKSKKCTLPSDRLTEKQIRERHGRTIVYNLNKPMDWITFKNLPVHAQKEYLSQLKQAFGVTATDIAKMFGVTASTVLRYTETQSFNIDFSRGHRMSGEKKSLWDEFLSDVSSKKDDVEPAAEVVDEAPVLCTPVEEKVLDIQPPKNQASNMSMSKISLEFNGVIDVNGLVNTLKAVLGSNIEGVLCISYNQYANKEEICN